MKNLFFILFSLFPTFLYSQLCPHEFYYINEYGQCNSNSWVLVFEDNFDGPNVDLTRWVGTQGVPRDPYFSSSKQWYSPNNLEVNNGVLSLVTKFEPQTQTYVTDWSTYPPTTQTASFNYSSAEISSRYQYGYGKYEIRCKIPKGKGFFPAFWTFGGPEWNEIDIFEFRNQRNCNNCPVDLDKSVKHQETNIHYTQSGPNSNNCQHTIVGDDYSASYHIFSVIWEPHKIEWYIDDNPVPIRTEWKYTNIYGQPLGCNNIMPSQSYNLINKAFPKQEYMNIIANLAIQNANDAPDNATIFPNSYDIDYIKFYKKIYCPSTLNIYNTSQLGLQTNTGIFDADYNLRIGSDIIVNGVVAIGNNQQVEFKASNIVDIKPGFWAMAGSDLRVNISNDICFKSKSSPVDGLYADNQQDKKRFSSEINNINGLSIFPNPSQGVFYITFPEDNIYFYEIINSMGTQIKNIQAISSERYIDLTEFPNGIYYITIFNDNFAEVYSSKLIKNR